MTLSSGSAWATAELAMRLKDEAEKAAEELAESIARGRVLYQERVGCAVCHGWDGGGAEEAGATPLLGLEMTLDVVAQIIACGRPGTTMEGFARDSCEAASPGPAAGSMSARQLNDVATYVTEMLIPGATVEECEAVLGVDAPSCVAPAN